MKKDAFKKCAIVVMAAVLALTSVFAVFAETAKETNKEGGRSVIVQDVKLEGQGASAKIARGNNEFVPAAGVRLVEGDVITTTGNAVVYLTVDSQMVLRLDNDTKAVVEKAAFGSKLVMNVKSGHMFYNVAKQTSESESLELMTNNITIAIRGTSGTLAFGNGTVQHMLYDGVVSVSDAKATRIQQPGELLSVGIGPGSTLESSAEVRNFILSEIPVSVAEEMRKDAGLAARILASVPVSIGADGARTYADAAYFNEHITGIDDVKVFAESLKKVREETTGGSSDPTPTPDPDPDPKECPYADGSKGGELYYIREVISDGYYKAIAYRYNTTAGKFEFRGLTNFDAGAGSNHKAGEWVHYHIMDGFVGVCTQNGDSAELPVLHTVKFDVNGQTVDYPPEDQEIADGQTAYNAYVSDTTGCTFDGWFTEKECVNKWDFSTPVTKDLTLYAHWLPKTMTIWMQAGADGTGGPESVDLTYGDKLQQLTSLPTHARKWQFLGYFTLDDEKIFDANGTPVSGAEDLIWSKYTGLTIHAEWQDPTLLGSAPESEIPEEDGSFDAEAIFEAEAPAAGTGEAMEFMSIAVKDEEFAAGTAEEY